MRIKRYLETLIHETTTSNEEADALEYAIYSNWVQLTYKLDQDTAIVQRQLLDFVEKFRRVAMENEATEQAQLQALVGAVDDYR